MKKGSQAQPSNTLTQLLPQIFRGTKDDFWQWWHAQLVNNSSCAVVFTPNPEQVVQAYHQPAFAVVLQAADLLLPDGIGLIWASKLLETSSIPVRISGREVVKQWLHQEKNPSSVRTLLLGGRSGVAQQLALEIDSDTTWLQGLAGYKNVRQPTEQEEELVQATIADFKPQVLFVAFGAPWQEMWISQHWQWLSQQGVQIVMAVGGAIDVLSAVQSVKAPPQWIEKLNLEWLFRLWQEPWRWRRQLRLLVFVFLVGKTWLQQKINWQAE